MYTCIQKPEVMSVFLSYSLSYFFETGCLTESRAHRCSFWLASKPQGS